MITTQIVLGDMKEGVVVKIEPSVPEIAPELPSGVKYATCSDTIIGVAFQKGITPTTKPLLLPLVFATPEEDNCFCSEELEYPKLSIKPITTGDYEKRLLFLEEQNRLNKENFIEIEKTFQSLQDMQYLKP